MAARIHKFEAKFPMKSPEKLVGFFRNHFCDLPQLVPAMIKTSKIIGGGSKMGPGSVFHVTYSLPGIPSLVSIKMKVEEMDDEAAGSKLMTLRTIEWDLMHKYPSYVARAEIDAGGKHVKWSVEYEKADPSVPAPLEYIELYKIMCSGSNHY